MGKKTNGEKNSNIAVYHITFPYYIFEQWFTLLEDENRKRKKILKAPLEFNYFLSILAQYFPNRQIEAILKILVEYNIIPYSLDYTTIWKRLQNKQNIDYYKLIDNKKNNKILKLIIMFDNKKNKFVNVQISVEDKNNVVSIFHGDIT
ncbi:hypothetical protein [Acidianus manzaensis]|uniref:Transposase n=1 Tax=Acidianus manzaensis TaxID=282676 RepID=A0A1W6K335_9CREN|nr:hypothetical protein [Acidianus manzaensis]ARM76854.1 hypothetical protein B6F84_13045 [Acidianus manzaensis]